MSVLLECYFVRERICIKMAASTSIFSRQDLRQIFSKCELLFKILTLFLFAYCYAFSDEIEDVLLCRNCGHEVAHAVDLKRVPTKLALRQRNDTILGVSNVLIQLFQNPEGSKFELITLTKADSFELEDSHPEHSWFPSFSWRISVCPRCGTHLGWFFQPIDRKELETGTNTFIGLILNKLLHQGYADSLLITPKSYKS